MASKTKGGQYLNVATGFFDLGDIYGALIKNQEKRFFETNTTIEREEKFQYFLLPGIMFITVFGLLYNFKRKRGS